MKNVIWLVIIGYGIYYFIKKNKKETPEEIEAQRLLQEERESNERGRLIELQKERESFIKSLEDKNELFYFSYSFVSENSPLYLIHGVNNDVISESKTTLKELYAKGFCLFQADKTGKSAQMNDFNFLIHVKTT